ncbi:Scr1 family TA system antitoxin-like transcriptional regulator [Streptomyces sp. NPDC005732]|uniref:helix-turn-helix domain-containing protein n=1 Tax=unclassified Streptomyces TaxID=2593676 RepID=UPI0033CA75B1
MARAENKVEAGGTARVVAALAKALREQQRLSQEELGALIGYTGSAVSAMETCAQPASDQMLIKLEESIGLGLGVFEKARGYIRADKYPPLFKDFAPLEQKALSLQSYAMLVVHGLFQTEAYARALIGGGYPPLSKQRVAELVEARMTRKSLFDRDPTVLIELVLDESALRRAVGSKEIMREQLIRLVEYGELRNVTLQVMPLARGLRGEHAGLHGEITLLESPDHEHVAYLEAQDESLLISDPAKVTTYTHRYAKIRAQALGPDESLGLIEQLAGE